MVPSGIVVHIANAENRVQNPKMIRSGLSIFRENVSLMQPHKLDRPNKQDRLTECFNPATVTDLVIPILYLLNGLLRL